MIRGDLRRRVFREPPGIPGAAGSTLGAKATNNGSSPDSGFGRVNVGLSVRSLERRGGFGVVHDRVGFGIKLQAAAELQGVDSPGNRRHC